MNIVDLHVHSNKSDGTFTPTELVDYAIEKGLSAFALTDHDTIDGLQEAIDYAARLRAEAEAGADGMVPNADGNCGEGGETSANYAGNTSRIIPEIIPGIELSTDLDGQEVHIVGLFVDYKDESFVAKLDEFINSRDIRNEKMCKALNKIGFPISMESMRAEFPEAVITRAHFAHWLVNHGYVKSRPEVFDRYIGNDAPYYIPREKITPMMAVEFLRNNGAVPVLAHPILYHLSKRRLAALVDTLKDAGLMAIEAIYSTYTSADERFIRTLAKEKGLLISGGSDFHGANKPKIDLAVGYGKLFIPEEVLTDIRAAREDMLAGAGAQAGAGCAAEASCDDKQPGAAYEDCDGKGSTDCDKQAIFVDLDGTLLRKDCTVSDKMRDTIKAYCDKGNHFIPTSGRPLMAIQEIMDNHHIDFEGSNLIIAYNGALIYDRIKQEAIQTYKVAQDDIRTIMAAAKKWGIHSHTYGDETIIARHMNEELAFYSGRIHLPIQYVEDPAEAAVGGSYKVQCIDLNDRSKLERFREEMLPIVGDRINIFFTSDKYLEFLSKEVSKGNALAYVRDYLGLTIGQTYAAGDEENDIPMLQAAGHGIAMANATDQVKAVAEVVTTLDNEHDGLAEVLGGIQ